jgi:polyphosphate kinase
VRSIVGRFLEHSRVYYFLNDGKEEVWLASADWMERNFHRRVEVAFPVISAPLRERIMKEAIDLCLKDNAQAWQLQADGTYGRVPPAEAGALSAQEQLLREYADVPALVS